MEIQDKCCSVAPYFKVFPGKLDSFKELCKLFIEQASRESKCLYFGFSFHENEVYCREGYEDADGLLEHVRCVEPLFKEALKLAEITRLEIHGIEKELTKLREPLSSLNPKFFTLECGFRR